MKTRSLFVVIILLGLFAGACSPAKEGESSGALNSVEELIAALEGQGVSMTKGEQFEQAFFSVPALLLNTDETSIQVFQYADQAAAQTDAELVAMDGSSVGTSMPFWVGDPHFYQKSRLIVLYLGSDENLLSALEAVMGPQFAGR